MSANVSLQHDEIGRVVGAQFDSPDQPASPTARWLVAVDGSPHSLRAVEHAVKMGQAMPGVALDVAYVGPWQSREASFDLPAHGMALTEPARTKIEAAGLPWRVHVVMGEVGPSIVALAERLGVDAIVIGTHGRSAVETVLLGSVAQSVVTSSKVPVWVVK